MPRFVLVIIERPFVQFHRADTQANILLVSLHLSLHNLVAGWKALLVLDFVPLPPVQHSMQTPNLLRCLSKELEVTVRFAKGLDETSEIVGQATDRAGFFAYLLVELFEALCRCVLIFLGRFRVVLKLVDELLQDW